MNTRTPAPTTVSAVRGRLTRTLLTVLSTIALLAGSPGLPAAAAAPTTSTPTTSTLLSVDLSGQFNDGSAGRAASRQSVVGTVASSWTSTGSVNTSRYGFTFNANCATVGGETTCAALQGAGKTLYWHWDFGDGRTKTTTGPTPGAPVLYAKPGVYTLTVTVDNTAAGAAVPADSYAGSAQLRVLVGPRFADVDAAGNGKASPTYSDPMWATAALGLLDPCGTYNPTVGQAMTAAAETDTGRALFCPQAPSLNAPLDRVDTGAVRTEYSDNLGSKSGLTFWRGGSSATAAGDVVGANNSDVLRFRDGGGSALWAQAATSIPYRAAQLYKISARIRVKLDASNDVARTVRVGVSAKDDTGKNLLVDGTTQGAGTDVDMSSQHWVAANGTTLRASDGWVTYSGYIKGTASSGTSSVATNRAAPGRFVTGTTSFTPAVVVNEGPGAGNGTWDVDYLRVEVVSASGATSSAATFTTNGITGTSCLTSARACGLPASAWANNNTGGDVSAPCGPGCLTDLFNRGYITATSNPQVVYRNDVCADNRSWRADGTTGTGVEDGCTSYAEFATALARALDDTRDTHDLELSTDGSCASTDAGVARLHKLLSATPTAAARPGLVRCTDTDAAITKGEAYALLAAATGSGLSTNRDFLAGFRDLSSARNLASGVYSASQDGEVLSGLADAGAPIVGDVECPDRVTRESDDVAAGTCFNSGEALTRVDAARLLGWTVLGADASTTDVRVEISPAAFLTAAGKPVAIPVKVHLPRWYAANSKVAVSWSGGSAQNVIRCPNRTAAVDAQRTAVLRCSFTGSNATGSPGQVFTATVRDDQTGATGTASVTIAVSNDAPVLGEANATGLNEGSTMVLTVPFEDPQGSAVTFGVRSCLPGTDGTCVSAATTFDRNDDKARTVTSDTDPGDFVQSAATDVGNVTITSSAGSAVTMKVTPFDENNNGSFDFVLQACDTGNSCVTKYLTGNYAPVNDLPQTLGLISVSTDAAGKTLTLGGTDTADTSQPGYPNPQNPLGQYMVCNIPAGWDVFWVASDNSLTPVVNAVPSTSNRIRVAPKPGTAPGSYTMRYNVRDNGHGPAAGDYQWASGSGSSCTGSLGEVQLTSTAVWPHDPITATLSPATVAGFTEPATLTVAGLAPGSAITVDWGDGSSTGPVNAPSISHVYRSPVTMSYTVTYTVVDGPFTYTATAGTIKVLTNHVSEPTFDYNASRGWSANGTEPLTVAAQAGRHQTGALLVGSSQVQEVHNDVLGAAGRVIAGKSYTAKLWLRTDNPAGGPVTVTFREPTGSVATLNAAVTSAWQQFTLTLPAATENNGSLDLQLTSTESIGSYLIDDVSVTGTVVGTLNPASAARSVTAGFANGCALSLVANTYCWGDGSRGSLGNGTFTTSAKPVAVSGSQSWKVLDFGQYTGCGITTTNAALCWGEGTSGQLGDGNTTNKAVPTAVNVPGATWKTISTGVAHVCAITTVGGAYCWGDNTDGRLGDGTEGQRSGPRAVLLAGKTWDAITAGSAHSCGITTDTVTYCWGDNTDGQIGDGTANKRLVATPVNLGGVVLTSLSAGARHTCGISSTNQLYCWGLNDRGQLGDGTTTTRRVPVQVASPSGGWKSVAAGTSTTCAISTLDDLYCWGAGDYGQLGNGATTSATAPVQVALPQALWTQVDVGTFGSCGVTTTAQAYCWGRNNNAQLGVNDPTITQSTTPTPIATWLP